MRGGLRKPYSHTGGKTVRRRSATSPRRRHCLQVSARSPRDSKRPAAHHPGCSRRGAAASPRLRRRRACCCCRAARRFDPYRCPSAGDAQPQVLTTVFNAQPRRQVPGAPRRRPLCALGCTRGRCASHGSHAAASCLFAAALCAPRFQPRPQRARARNAMRASWARSAGCEAN